MSKYLLGLFTFVVTCLCAFKAHAQYPSAKENWRLREQLSSDSDRLIPKSDHFVFAFDGDAYFRNNGSDEFYHGLGYWTQARVEANSNEFFRVNLRSILYAGSCSAGYADPGGQYNLLSMTGQLPEPVFGGTLFLRGPDLDRQTIGVGLVVQEKEFNGAMLRWDHINDGHNFTFRADGTGLFRLNDDTYSWEASIFKGYFGAGAILWTQGIDQDHLDHNRAPYYYAFSTHTYDWFTYGAEFGSRENRTAGLVSVSGKQTFGNLKADLKLEARRYNPGFAADFAGQIEQQYISYDQYDKDYTNAANIFVVDDDVNVGAAHLNLWWHITHDWRLHSLNETGKFDYKAHTPVSFYYFRQGVEFCPYKDRDDCLNIFVSNKVLANSFAKPPHQISVSDDPLFKALPFFGMEARFRL